jgi:hypothetical protein
VSGEGWCVDAGGASSPVRCRIWGGGMVIVVVVVVVEGVEGMVSGWEGGGSVVDGLV